jgi:hypothetical protein
MPIAREPVRSRRIRSCVAFLRDFAQVHSVTRVAQCPATGVLQRQFRLPALWGSARFSVWHNDFSDATTWYRGCAYSRALDLVGFTREEDANAMKRAHATGRIDT